MRRGIDRPDIIKEVPIISAAARLLQTRQWAEATEKALSDLADTPSEDNIPLTLATENHRLALMLLVHSQAKAEAELPHIIDELVYAMIAQLAIFGRRKP